MVLNTGHLNHWAIAGNKIIEIIKIDRQEIKLLNRIELSRKSLCLNLHVVSVVSP